MVILVNLLVIALIILMYWFFFMKPDGQVVAGQNISVVVDGGYKPAVIEIKQNQTATLVFDRQDPTSCLEEVVIPDFSIRQFLPLHQKTTVTLTPHKVGSYTFHCGMSMYFGTIKVVV